MQSGQLEGGVQTPGNTPVGRPIGSTGTTPRPREDDLQRFKMAFKALTRFPRKFTPDGPKLSYKQSEPDLTWLVKGMEAFQTRSMGAKSLLLRTVKDLLKAEGGDAMAMQRMTDPATCRLCHFVRFDSLLREMKELERTQKEKRKLQKRVDCVVSSFDDDRDKWEKALDAWKQKRKEKLI